jgi:hypothetical protein
MDLVQAIQPVAPVLSNVNSSKLEKLLEVVNQTNEKSSLLRPGRDLIVVERDHSLMQRLMKDFLPTIMPNYVSYLVDDLQPLPHHRFGPASMMCYRNTDPTPNEPLRVISGIKGSDSIAEKITRLLADDQIINEVDPSQLNIEDTYRFKVICSTREDCEKIKDNLRYSQFGESSYLLFEKEKNHINDCGDYSSLHTTFLLFNGESEVNGTRLRIHLEDVEDHINNERGTKQNPNRAHTTYALQKIRKPHRLDNYQIVVVDHPGNLDNEFGSKTFDISSKDFNGECRYDLLKPTFN